MKIAIVLRTLNKSNGAARVVLQQAQGFRNLGHDVHIYAEKLSPLTRKMTSAVFHQITTWPLSGSWSRKFFQTRVERQLKKSPYDLIIGHGDIFHQDILFLHNCVHLQGELVQHRQPVPPERESPLEKRHRKIITESPYRVLIANSNLMKNDLIKRFGIPAEKILVSYPSIDPQLFQYRDKNAVEYRTRLGLTKTDFLFGLITSGEPYMRGADTLLKAFLNLKKENQQQAHLLLMGKGMTKLKSEIPDSNNKFVTLLEPHANVQDFYKALDVFVLPARLDTFGLTVIESMACGTPVIVSQNVGAQEVLPNSLKTFIVSAENVSQLTTQLDSITKKLKSNDWATVMEKELHSSRETNSDASRFHLLVQNLKLRGII